MPHPTSQFDPNGSMKNRTFERLLLVNRSLNTLVSHTGKLALTCLIWPRFVAPYRWKLTRYPLPLRNLDPAFHNYKILHLTDLHLGRTNISYIHRVLEESLRTRPDLIVITGDLIHYRPSALTHLPSVLKRLQSAAPPDGILAIFGNHDYHEYSWKHTGARSAQRSIHKRLVHAIQYHGIKLLRNESHTIQKSSARLTLVGLDEMWTGRADPARAFAGLHPDDPVICLQHNPDGYTFLKDFPWQFMLCGHSHGGQANFPFLGPLIVPMEHPEWLRGFIQFHDEKFGHRTMFVSTGIGHSTPIRMRVPPETTLFTLTFQLPPADKHNV